MDDSIIKILGFKQDDANAVITHKSASRLDITLSKTPKATFCPICSCKMHSKGIYSRNIRHPILQDNRRLTLTINQRRYKCTNRLCGYSLTEEFSFVDKYKQTTNTTDYLIIQDFRDHTVTAASIARKYHVSDTYVINTFARYVDLDRLPLSEAICVDEVYLNIPGAGKYALVIQDFITGEPIDILPDRKKETTEPFFSSIPIQERLKVKYLIADMYKPYHKYIFDYFPNAVHIVDSFHVIQYINSHLQGYLRRLVQTIDEKDHAEHDKLEKDLNRKVYFHHSKEYYIAKNWQWLILKNLDNIKYSTKPKYDKYLHCYMCTIDYEEALFKIDPTLKRLRDLKEEYIKFNNRYVGFPELAAEGLEKLIDMYRHSEQILFSAYISKTLSSNFDSIVNSFIVIQKHTKNGLKESRLSNGPIEALNRVPKDLKRNGNGYRNFEHVRQRVLFACRKEPPIRAIPKPLIEVLNPTGVKRGPYKKKSSEVSEDE